MECVLHLAALRRSMTTMMMMRIGRACTVLRSRCGLLLLQHVQGIELLPTRQLNRRRGKKLCRDSELVVLGNETNEDVLLAWL